MRKLHIGLHIGLSAPRLRDGIRSITPPVFGPYDEGDEPTDAYTPGTYASVAGDIDTVVAQWTVNGAAWDEVSTLDPGDVVGLRELVTDTESNSRLFSWGSVAVPSPEPPAEGTVFTTSDGDIFETSDGETLLTA